MKEQLLAMDEVLRMICEAEKDESLLFLSYLEAFNREYEYIADRCGRTEVDYVDFVLLWEQFGSESCQEFTRDLLHYVYEQDDGNISYKSIINRILPETDEIKQALIKGMVDTSKSFNLRWYFFQAFYSTFYNEFKQEIPGGGWVWDEYCLDSQGILDQIHLYVNVETATEPSVDTSSAKPGDIPCSKSSNAENSTLVGLRKLNTLFQLATQNAKEYESSFIHNCLKEFKGLWNSNTAHGGQHNLRKDRRILPVLDLWESYNPESYERFVIEVLNDIYYHEEPEEFSGHTSPRDVLDLFYNRKMRLDLGSGDSLLYHGH